MPNSNGSREIRLPRRNQRGYWVIDEEVDLTATHDDQADAATDAPRQDVCPTCGNSVPMGSVRRVWQQNKNACSECRIKKGLAERFYYTYRPDFHVFGLRSQPEDRDEPRPSLANGVPLTLGIENEIEGGTPENPDDWRSAVTALQHILPHDLAYFKPDATIEGIEWVMHPMTVEYFYTIDWENIFSRLHLYQTNRVGLHIHMGRQCFTPVLLYKMLQFYEKCAGVVDRVAERTPNSHCFRVGNISPDMALHHNLKKTRRKARKNQKPIDVPEPPQAPPGFNRSEWVDLWTADYIRRHTQVAPRRAPSLDHHMQVNVQNRGTVEVRVFAGATQARQLYKAVEFVVSVYEFCQQVGLKDATSEEKYLNFLSTHRQKFSTLYKFVVNGYQFDPPIKLVHKQFEIPSARNWRFNR